MIAKKSPLILNTFYLIENQYKFIPIEEAPHDIPQDLFNNYTIDIDFAIRDNDALDEENVGFSVFTKLGVNQSKLSIGGYALFLETVGQYSLKTTGLSENDIENLKNLSSISIMINCMRGLIMDITSNGPLGRYILPSIDVNDLLNQKSQRGKRKSRVKKVIQ